VLIQHPGKNASRREVLGSVLKLIGAAGSTAVLPGSRLPGQGATPAANPRRIDLHHHHRPPGEVGGPNNQWTPAASIEQMDRYGIATALVSLSQQATLALSTVYAGGEKGLRLARSANEYGAKMAQDYPGRFGLFASVPLPDAENSLREIEYAFDTLKADGIGLYTNTGDKWLGDPRFAPVFDELNRRKAVVFIHPIVPNCCRGLIEGVTDFALEIDFDMSRGIMSLLVNGTFSRCPNITFILAHSGGTLPVLAGRIKDRYPKGKVYEDRIPNGVLYELKRLHFEVAHATFPEPLAALLKFVPPSQVHFGTDYPAEPIASTVDHLPDSGLPAEVLRAIDRRNAERLFPRFKG
jgi:predicted TIM-barrel fold metal-dependent hydrolase